jgi:hypothetical protein
MPITLSEIGAEPQVAILRSRRTVSVYDFLEKLGVRWLGLGEENEYVPELRRFHLREGYVEKPGFGLRGFWAFRKNRGTEQLFSWMGK